METADVELDAELDADLCAGVAAGDRSAFTGLFDRHVRAVANHCFRLSGSWMCMYRDSGEGSGALSGDRWTPHTRQWLPGPIERLLLTSSEVDGGDVAVIGRVGEGIRRIVLEHGDGHTSEARFGNGMFAILSDGGPVGTAAQLVSYDGNGQERDRRPLFQHRDTDACFVDPAGVVVYGVAGDNCRPGNRWRR
jgi:hypothetical protein